MSDKMATEKFEGLTVALTVAVIASAFGSAFQHGYNTGVVNAPARYIIAWIERMLSQQDVSAGGSGVVPETRKTFIWSIAVSIFCVGGMIGGLFSGTVGKLCGSRGGLLLNNVLVILAALLEGFSRYCGSYLMLIVGRFLSGANSGLNSGLCPTYLTEISPTQLRGATGSVYQLVVTISILVSQIIGLNFILGNEELWPHLFFLTFIPSIFQLVVLPFCPESPVYLESKSKPQQAEKALMKLRDNVDVQEELDEIRAQCEAQKSQPTVTMGQIFSNRMFRIPMMITTVVMIAQQLSGINAVMYFSTEIFKQSGLSDNASQYATIGMGFMNVVMTLISVILVELCGRKTLLLVGFGGMFWTSIVLTVAIVLATTSHIASYFSIILVILFVIFFAVGPGSIPWFLVNELFPPNARPIATSISVGVNWTANFMVGLGFLPIQEVIGGYVFVIFAVLQGLFFLFILKKVPETKNKTIEDISAAFRRSAYE